MLEHETWLVPTLVAPLGVLEQADAGVTMRRAREGPRDDGDPHATISRAIAAGVRGDGHRRGVVPHGDNLRELPDGPERDDAGRR